VPRPLNESFGKRLPPCTLSFWCLIKKRQFIDSKKDRLTKIFCHGYYGITTGGVVEKREPISTRQHREATEELGFDAPLEKAKAYSYEAKGFKIGKIYTCYYARQFKAN